MAEGKKIRVLLADDHNLVREGFRRILEGEPDMEIVGEVADGREAVAAAERTRPNVVLMDLFMPELNGIEATRQIREQPHAPSVICLSMHKEHRIVAAILRAGAAGYLLKDCGSEEMTQAIRTVASGGTFLSPSVAGGVVDAFVRNAPEAREGVFGKLTVREREVLQLIAEGLNAKEIGGRLGISQKTALAHRRSMMEKLQLWSDVALARYAIREGLVKL